MENSYKLHVPLCTRVSMRACICVYALHSKCAPGLQVDSNEAGTLLVGLRPHAFDQFELLPVDEGTILLPPLCNILRPACI